MYLEWMEPRIKEIYRVLKKTGSFYLHCDWHADAYLRVLCDQIFDRDPLNRICWLRTNAKGTGTNKFGVIHDVILIYTKSDDYIFNIQKEKSKDLSGQYKKKDNKGYYRSITIIKANSYVDVSKGQSRYFPTEDKTVQLDNKHGWVWTQNKIDEFVRNGGEFEWSSGGLPNYKKYLDANIPCSDVWDGMYLHPSSKERLGYPTQKPEALLERIIKTSSNENDVVLDAFCGCYDGETELLTENGWVKFKNLENERIAQVEGNTIEYVDAITKQKYIHNGKMYHWKSTMYDILVTPDHNMYAAERKTAPTFHYTDYDFIKAKDIKWLAKIKRNCNGISSGNIPKPPNNIDPHAWCKFLGFWLGDGYIDEGKTSTGYRVGIRQIKDNDSYIKNFLNKMNIVWKKTEGRYTFNNEEIFTYLKQCHKQPTRTIPREVLNYDKPYLQDVLEGLILSDGMTREDGIRIYSISKQLIDNIAEIMVKLGICVTISKRLPRTEKKMSKDGRLFWSKSICYCISGTIKRTESTLKHAEIIDWNDYVYCVTVPSHIIIIRREGKVILNGNCGTTIAVAKKLNRQWIGIDVSPTACRLIAKRLKVRFDIIEGLPITPEEIAQLDGYEFQNFVIREFGGFSGNRGADGGIDGNLGECLIQVKKFKAGRAHLDAFSGTLLREKQTEGIFIATEFSADFRAEVARLKRENEITIHYFDVKDILEHKHYPIVDKFIPKKGLDKYAEYKTPKYLKEE